MSNDNNNKDDVNWKRRLRQRPRLTRTSHATNTTKRKQAVPPDQLVIQRPKQTMTSRPQDNLLSCLASLKNATANNNRDDRYKYELELLQLVKEHPILALHPLGASSRLGASYRHVFLMDVLFSDPVNANHKISNAKLFQAIFHACPHRFERRKRAATIQRIYRDGHSALFKCVLNAMIYETSAANDQTKKKIYQYELGLNLLEYISSCPWLFDPPALRREILQQFPNKHKITHWTFLVDAADDTTNSANHNSFLVDRVLPTLTHLASLTMKFSYLPSGRSIATEARAVGLLRSLQACTTLTDLRVDNIPSGLLNQEALQHILDHNPSITKLYIEQCFPGRGDPTPMSRAEHNQRFLEALGLGGNQTSLLKLIELRRWLFITEASFLVFLTAAPPMVMWEDVQVLATSSDTAVPPSLAAENPVTLPVPSSIQSLASSSPSRVQLFNLNNIIMPWNTYQKLLYMIITFMPSLQGLEWVRVSVMKKVPEQSEQQPAVDLDLTRTLVTLLGRNQLAKLIVSGTKTPQSIDFEPICQALQTNTSLKHYDIPSTTNTPDNQAMLLSVLKAHNTTLECFTKLDPSGGPDNVLLRDIFYHTTLNKYGRRQVIRHEMTLNDFFRMFDRVYQDHHNDRENSEMSVLEQHRIIYGILRQSPGLWCHQFLHLLETFDRSIKGNDKKKRGLEPAAKRATKKAKRGKCSHR